MSLKNIFVLSVGRTASTTFAEACAHATNFTAAHESRSRRLLPDRLNYPDNHIEVDNRLSFYLPLLGSAYKEDTGYVFLRRDQSKSAASYAERWNLSISVVRAHATATLMSPGPKTKEERLAIADDYIDLTTRKIEQFVASQERSITVNLESLSEDFRRFWAEFGLEGPLERALEEIETHHNQNTFSTPMARTSRLVSKSRRLVRSLPSFIRDI